MIVGSAAGIKSVQRGTSNAGVVTIAEVNPEKTVCNLLTSSGSSAAYLLLNSSTSLLVGGSNVRWEVIEYV